MITSGLCTGCAGCVIACPHDVIGYEHEPGAYKPFHLEEELGDRPTASTGRRAAPRAPAPAPRFRMWETRGRPDHLHGRDPRTRRDGGHLLRHLADPGQATISVYDDRPGRRARVGDADLAASRTTIIDGALTSDASRRCPTARRGGRPFPMRRHQPPTRCCAGAGSRYTYSANTMAFDEAKEKGLETPRPGRYELSDLGCAGDVEPQDRQGLQDRSSSTSGCCAPSRFDDALFDELF